MSGLAAGLDVRLGRAVTAVAALQGGGVRVRVAGGATMLADRVIVTVPLGVLKAAGGGGGGGGGAGHEGRGGVAFDPAPPRALRDAIARLGFGEAIKARLATRPEPRPEPSSRGHHAHPMPADCPPPTHRSPPTPHPAPRTPHPAPLTPHPSPLNIQIM